MTSNTDRRRAVTWTAPTIDISPQRQYSLLSSAGKMW